VTANWRLPDEAAESFASVKLSQFLPQSRRIVKSRLLGERHDVSPASGTAPVRPELLLSCSTGSDGATEQQDWDKQGRSIHGLQPSRILNLCS
jgi:hypothetical protein